MNLEMRMLFRFLPFFGITCPLRYVQSEETGEAVMDGKCVLVIPARRRSTRLPDKLLLRAGGKTVLQHTFEAASRTQLPDRVLIATDDDEIAREVRSFGAEVVMTSPACVSGTDRVAEAVRTLAGSSSPIDPQIVVNLQGDEPEIDADAIDRLIDRLRCDRTASMATLATPIRDRAMLADPACVKVVFDQSGRALYFSRSPIPFLRDDFFRDGANAKINEEAGDADLFLDADRPLYHQHIGVYAYRRELLLRLASLPQGRLEQAEKLEQLRVLEHGETILVALVDQPTRGIDTAEDYAAFLARLAA